MPYSTYRDKEILFAPKPSCLGVLARALPDCTISGKDSLPVTDITHDSRSVRPGSLFVAIRGDKADGNDFIFTPGGALQAGASVVCSERPAPTNTSLGWIQTGDIRKTLAILSRIFFEDPSRKMELVGITGTKGKTTTSYLVDSLFRVQDPTSCLIGTIESRIGEQVWPAERTTPESSDLQRLLYHAVQQGCRRAVLEVSSHSLVLHRVYGMSFQTACFTNLTRDHLDFHQEFESYYQAKSSLFGGEEIRGPKTAVINGDDAWGKRLLAERKSSVLSYGTSSSADVRPEKEEVNLNPISLRVLSPQGVLEISSHLVGKGNLYNILAAVGIGLSLNMPGEIIECGIAKVAGVPGRLESIDVGQPFSVIVDYAHTDAALENLLQIARGLRPKRVVTVFGCGGDRDRGKRPRMAEVAADYSDMVIVTNDNPRSERPEDIAAEIETGFCGRAVRWTRQLDRRAAIEEAVRFAEPGDVILIAGKGHETYQEINGKKIDFDDRVVAREMVQRRMEGK
jgi:UDP-N-acetylmuramoyl-L-alanyl-D-glutamate--2,6-diaminopimelate ligase